MKLPRNKTKIICTIGRASDSPSVMEQMIKAGMNVARINFAHGDFASHQKMIENLRAAASVAGRRLTILADLPGPKIRIGQLTKEPIELKPGDAFTLTTEEIVGDANRDTVLFFGKYGVCPILFANHSAHTTHIKVMVPPKDLNPP